MPQKKITLKYTKLLFTIAFLLMSVFQINAQKVKIDGVEHEFSTIKGVVEDVTEIILNLKQVRFKRQIEDQDEEKSSIETHECLSPEGVKSGSSKIQKFYN